MPSSAQRTAVKLRPHQETKTQQVATSEPVVVHHGREGRPGAQPRRAAASFNSLLGGAIGAFLRLEASAPVRFCGNKWASWLSKREMRAFLTISLMAAACTPELGKTDEPELEKSPLVWEEKQTALQAVDVLVEPHGALAIGRVCYYEGVAPRGRRAVERLVNMGRADLLGRALKAPSPEGRLYAAIGLARLGKLSWDEVAAQAAKEGEVEVCSGCIVEHVRASRAIDYYEAGVAEPDE